jgi:hypothetical protein
VAEAADARAANAFESTARAIALDVPGLHLVPQLRLAPGTMPDLVDPERRHVVEQPAHVRDLLVRGVARRG